MATKYGMEVRDSKTGECTPIALFSDLIPPHVLCEMGRVMLDNIVGAAEVIVMDLDTGEIL